MHIISYKVALVNLAGNMPRSGAKVVDTAAKKCVTRSAARMSVDKNNGDAIEEDAYDRLLKQVKDNRAKRNASPPTAEPVSKKANTKSLAKKTATKKQKADQSANLNTSNQQLVQAQIVEDDSIMEIEVGEQQNDLFPSEDEGEEGEIVDDSSNNNTTLSAPNGQTHSAQRSTGVKHILENLPKFRDEGPGYSTDSQSDGNLKKMLTLMQNFMMKGGLINSSMTTEEMQAFIETSSEIDTEENNRSSKNNRESRPR